MKSILWTEWLFSLVHFGSRYVNVCNIYFAVTYLCATDSDIDVVVDLYGKSNVNLCQKKGSFRETL